MEGGKGGRQCGLRGGRCGSPSGASMKDRKMHRQTGWSALSPAPPGHVHGHLTGKDGVGSHSRHLE